MKRRTHSISYEAVTNGPTQERLRHAQGAYVVGGDERSERVWHMLDGPVDRLYARLEKSAGKLDSDQLQVEYTALVKYRYVWAQAGLEPTISSVDLNRVFAAQPGSTKLGSSEYRQRCLDDYRGALMVLGMIDSHIVERVVCRDIELPDAGYSLGYTSSYRARQAAEKRLRGAAQALADHWGIG